MSKSAAGVLIDLVENGMRMHPCPGWKRPCGVNTLRPFCFYCTKSKALERGKR